jgi:DNA-binding beta-propeller fold protein YncE
VDPATRIPTDTLDVGPVCCVAAGAGAVWVLTLPDPGRPLPSLFLVDPAAVKVAKVIDMPTALTGTPIDIALGEGFVWVADDDGSVGRFDATTGVFAGVSHTPPGAVAVAVGQGAAWVLSYLRGTVTRIDPATGAAGRAIQVGPRPAGIAVGEGSIWVALEGS